MQHPRESVQNSTMPIYPNWFFSWNPNFLSCPNVPPAPSNMINSNMPGGNYNHLLLQAAATSQQLPSGSGLSVDQQQDICERPDELSAFELDIAATLCRVMITLDTKFRELNPPRKEFVKSSSSASAELGSASENEEMEQPLCVQQSEQEDPQQPAQAPSNSPRMLSSICIEKINELNRNIVAYQRQRLLNHQHHLGLKDAELPAELNVSKPPCESDRGPGESEYLAKQQSQRQVPQQADSLQQTPSTGMSQSTNAKVQIGCESFQNISSRPSYLPLNPQSALKPKNTHRSMQLKCCKGILKELMCDFKHHEYVSPFFNSSGSRVHRALITKKLVRKPMDLRTIKRKLDSGRYKRPEDFAADMRLIFTNCLNYNFPNRQSVPLVIKLQNVFETKYAKMPEMHAMFNGSSESALDGFTESVCKGSSESVFNSSSESEIDVENDSEDGEILDFCPSPPIQVPSPSTCAGTSSSSGTQPGPFIHHPPLLNPTLGLPSPYLNAQLHPPQTSLFTGLDPRVPYSSSDVTSSKTGTYPAGIPIQPPQDFIRESQPTINFNHNPWHVPVTSQFTRCNPSYPQSSDAGASYLINGTYPVHPLMHSSQEPNPIVMSQSSTPFLNNHRPISMSGLFPGFNSSTPFLSSAGPSSGIHPASSSLESQACKIFHRDVVEKAILQILRQTGRYPPTLDKLCESILANSGIQPSCAKCVSLYRWT